MRSGTAGRRSRSEVLSAKLRRIRGMSSASLYAWRKKYGGMEVSDAKKLRAPEDENRRLKKLVAEQAFGALVFSPPRCE